MAEGTVKWFSNQKGYGFIETKDRDVFVHYSEIKDEGYKTLKKGDKVEFDIATTDKGDQAKNVVKISAGRFEAPARSARKSRRD